MMKSLSICLFGASSDQIDKHYIEEVEQLGREMGKRGYRLIFGGGSTGLMGAAARGAAAGGGHIIGVIPRFMYEFEALYDQCDELIHTDTMHERKEIMEDRADAFIIVPGGIGTLDEFFEILTLVSLEKKTAPIILYNIDGYFNSLISFIDSCTHKGFIRPLVRNLFRVCDTPDKAFDLIERYV